MCVCKYNVHTGGNGSKFVWSAGLVHSSILIIQLNNQFAECRCSVWILEINKSLAVLATAHECPSGSKHVIFVIWFQHSSDKIVIYLCMCVHTYKHTVLLQGCRNQNLSFRSWCYIPLKCSKEVLHCLERFILSKKIIWEVGIFLHCYFAIFSMLYMKKWRKINFNMSIQSLLCKG